MGTQGFRYAIQRGGKSYGVESVDQLQDLARMRKIVSQDYVFIYEKSKWVRAGQISALASIFVAQTNGNVLEGIRPEHKLSAPELSRSQVSGILAKSADQVKEEANSYVTGRPLRTTVAQPQIDFDELFDEFPEDSHEKQRMKDAVKKAEFQKANLGNATDRVYQSLSASSVTASPTQSGMVAVQVDKLSEERFSRKHMAIGMVVGLILMAAVAFGSFWVGFLWDDNPQMASQTTNEPLPIRSINN